MIRLQIYLAEEEQAALERLALTEMRSLREQIRYIIREDLFRRGLLAQDPRPIFPVQSVVTPTSSN